MGRNEEAHRRGPLLERRRWGEGRAARPEVGCIFPRDPDFAAKAGRILDLYERQWEGVPLLPTDFVAVGGGDPVFLFTEAV
jgi:hypothetical protein